MDENSSFGKCMEIQELGFQGGSDPGQGVYNITSILPLPWDQIWAGHRRSTEYCPGGGAPTLNPKPYTLQAAQAVEPAALVAIQLVAGGGRVVLVGDPRQLPATLLSRAAQSANLAQSLFERLQQVRYEAHLYPIPFVHSERVHCKP